MLKIIREVDQERGILQITTSDSRWYMKATRDKVTGLPVYVPVPSVTWIADYWPNKQLENWRAEKGLDEAEAIMRAAGEKGTVVHMAIEKILQGEEFRVDTKVEDKNRSSEQETYMRDLTYEELVCVKSFCDWRATLGGTLEVIANEITVFSEIHDYAGTVDLVCRIGGVPYVIDFKTSKAVRKSHEMQVNAYRMALENGENPLRTKNPNGTEGPIINLSGMKMAVLQVGYAGNKDGFKFTEIGEAFNDFKVAQIIWRRENTSKKTGDILTPGFAQKDFPLVLSAKVEAKTAPVATQDAPTEAQGQLLDTGAVEAPATPKKAVKAAKV